MNVIKFIGAWGCIVAAAVFIVLSHGVLGMPVMACSLLSLAFSYAPSNA